MCRHHIRTAYVIQTVRCMVCRPGQSESGADHMVMAVIDFHIVLRSFTPNIVNLVKYFYEFGFYQY